MAISKSKKKEILSELGKVVKDSASLVFVNFHGVTANDTNDMRKALAKSNVGYKVAKKTLARKALTEANIPGDIPAFEGELAVVYGVDAIAPAREVYVFQKKYEDKVRILGGVFEGKFVAKDQMMTIALIPSRETLYAQFVNIINSPIAGFVRGLDAIAKSKN